MQTGQHFVTSVVGESLTRGLGVFSGENRPETHAGGGGDNGAGILVKERRVETDAFLLGSLTGLFDELILRNLTSGWNFG